MAIVVNAEGRKEGRKEWNVINKGGRFVKCKRKGNEELAKVSDDGFKG